MGLCASLLLIIALPSMADKKDDDDSDLPNGQPFQELQSQINELRNELYELKGDVDYEGESVRDKVGFILHAGDSYALDIPKNSHRAVRIEITLRFQDGDEIYFPSDADDAPSNLMYATVYRNPRQSDSDIELSWIGTDSNGSNSAGTFSRSDGDKTIAVIYGELADGPIWLGRLIATDDRRILVEQNVDLEGTFFEDGRYVVTIW